MIRIFAMNPVTGRAAAGGVVDFDSTVDHVHDCIAGALWGAEMEEAVLVAVRDSGEVVRSLVLPGGDAEDGATESALLAFIYAVQAEAA